MTADIPLFIYGTLSDNTKQKEILGRVCESAPALLSKHRICRGKWPYLAPQIGSFASGWLISNLSSEDWAKLDQYEEVDKNIYVRQQIDVISQGTTKCWVYMPVMENWPKEWLEENTQKEAKAG